MDPTQVPDENIGNRLLTAIWTEATIAIIVVGLRVYTRARILRQVTSDDYLMVLALVFAIISAGFSIKAVAEGFGRHVIYLSPTQKALAVKFQFLGQPLVFMSQTLGRVSFAVFLVRIFGLTRTRRMILYFIVSTQLIINIAFCILFYNICHPIASYWDINVSGKCFSLKILSDCQFFTQSWNVLTDLVLALLPGVIIAGTSMEIKKKISILFLMCLGIFNMVAAIVSVVQTKSIAGRGDLTYNYVDLDIWTSLQTYLVIIAASIPTTTALFKGRKISGSDFLRYAFYRSSGNKSPKTNSSDGPSQDHRKQPKPNTRIRHDRSFPWLPYISRTMDSTCNDKSVSGLDFRGMLSKERIIQDQNSLNYTNGVASEPRNLDEKNESAEQVYEQFELRQV